MDARSRHLIALVQDGATLGEAAGVYGISGERVRQLLQQEGVRIGRRARAERRRFSRDDCAAALRRVADLVGHPPTEEEYKAYRLEREPTSDTIGLRYGGCWVAREAITAGDGGDGRPAEAMGRQANRGELPPITDLALQLDCFRKELRAAGLRASTIHQYLAGSSLFVRWLASDYMSRGPR